MDKIAVIIKTTPKRKSLLWLLNSIELSLEEVEYRIYLADEKPLDEWKLDSYKKLRQDGHFLKIWDEPVAVTVARNNLIDHLQDENYVLRVDDDFELGGEFNIDALLTILENNDNIDFCCDIERQIGNRGKVASGDIRIQSAKIILRKNKNPLLKFVKDGAWKYRQIEEIKYAKADYMRNLILLKRYCFDKVRWNENLIFTGEHLDFYLSLKAAGFQGAFTPDSVHLHRDDLKNAIINKKKEKKWRRKQKKRGTIAEFKSKWNGYPEKRQTIFKEIKKVINKYL